MNAKRKNQVLSKLNKLVGCATMRNGKVSVMNPHPGRVDGVTEFWQASLSDVEFDLENGGQTRDDWGNGCWSIGEGYRAARPGDLVNCSDPYTKTTQEIITACRLV